MGPKLDKKPRKPMKPRTQPAVQVTEELKLEILSLLNDRRYNINLLKVSIMIQNCLLNCFRECLFKETTPRNTVGMKLKGWSEVLEFCHQKGAKYIDIGHLKSIFSRWKAAFHTKKEAAKKTGGGGKKFEQTAVDDMMHNIIYGSKEVDTFEVKAGTFNVHHEQPQHVQARPD